MMEVKGGREAVQLHHCNSTIHSLYIINSLHTHKLMESQVPKHPKHCTPKLTTTPKTECMKYMQIILLASGGGGGGRSLVGEERH